MNLTGRIDTDAELRHGYTLSEINRLAKVAVWRDVWHQSLPLTDRQDIAWSAIAEHLYASDHKPTTGELVKAAWNALRAETEAQWHTHGVSRTTTVFDGSQTMPGFGRYWYTFGRNTQGPEEPIIERIALAQIWDALPEKHRVLIAALAATDDYGQAAAALVLQGQLPSATREGAGDGHGWPIPATTSPQVADGSIPVVLGRPRQSYVSMLARARTAFRELWHEGETPSRHWGTDRRRNPDAAYNQTHPGRSAAAEMVRRRKRNRQAAASA